MIIVFLYRNFHRWQNPKFKEKFGALLDGKKTKSRWTVIVPLAIFFLRRLAFVLSVINLSDFLWGQIALQLFFSLANMMFIQWSQPYELPYFNRKETFSEVCILCLSYFGICFTNFVPDPEVRSELGRFYIGTNSFMILALFLLVLASSLKIGKLFFKKYWNRWTNKGKIAGRKAPVKKDQGTQVDIPNEN